MSVVSTYLKYTQYGEPVSVLKQYEETLDEPKNNEVLVKILAAPVNPADINVIQGKPIIRTSNLCQSHQHISLFRKVSR